MGPLGPGGRVRAAVAAAGHLAVWMGLYGGAALVCAWQLLPPLRPAAWGQAACALLAAVLLTTAVYLLDRVKLSDRLLDPADRQAQPARFEFLRRRSKTVRFLSFSLALIAATFVRPLDAAAPLLVVGSVGAVVVYAGLSRGRAGGRRRVKDILIVKNAVVSAGLVGLAMSLLLLASPRERGVGAIVETALEHWAVLAVVAAHLLVRVFADAVLCDLDDEESDRAYGTDTIPTRLRRRRAWWVAGALRVVSALMLLAWAQGPPEARIAWAAAICAGTAGLALWRPGKVRDLVDVRFAVEAAVVAIVLAV
ncbi:MAG: hypothetical protein IT437_10360 [Phycisphaerales bacterium]|nr:hypothetical protein [Phycisphaerales bacterium]